jgi:hypothetical protein
MDTIILTREILLLDKYVTIIIVIGNLINYIN